MFETCQLPIAPDALAPDGSEVRILLRLAGGSMAHFELAPGKISRAVAHQGVEEIWYFISGRGEMWRKWGDQEQLVDVKPGTCLTIPMHTFFQFRTLGDEPLEVVAITMPPWPGNQEAVMGEGIWYPTE